MQKNTLDLTGAIVATNSLKEAEELLRLIDEGRLEELNAWLAAAQAEARREAVREILETSLVKS